MSTHVRSRTPLMIGMALILALPLVLTAGIGIYRAERTAPPAAEGPRGGDADRPDAATPVDAR